MTLNNKKNIDFGLMLSRKGLSKTSFRKKLIKLFYQSKSSLSIDEIVNNISYKVDKVSVYRALNAFEENGLIHKVPDKNNLMRYALCQSECSSTKHSHNHAHLLCNKCNTTYCLNDFKIPIEAKYKDFIISHSKIILEGRCIDCQ
tara:strand:+ start:181 stop:615 length:435 start_codon:yes stop_codon:yes gene_type:complete